MKQPFFLSTMLLFTFLAFNACKTKPEAKSPEAIELGLEKKETEKEHSEVPMERPCIEPQALEEVNLEEDFTKAEILDSRIEGNCLYLKFQYSGCNEGEPLFLAKGAESAKRGQSAYFELWLRGAGPCEMLIEVEEKFNLASSGQGAENVSILVNDQKVGDYRAY